MTAVPGVAPACARVGTLARVVVGALLAMCVASAFALVATLQRVDVVSRFLTDSTSVTDADVGAADDAVVLTNVVWLLALVATAVLFVIWLYRSVVRAKNARRDVIRYHAAWAVVGWIVPVWSLFRPKQMVDDVYKATAGLEQPEFSVPWYFHVWWATWLAGSLLSSVSAGLPGDTLDDIRTGDNVEAASDIAFLVAGVFAVAVVVTVARRVSLVPEVAPLPTTYVANYMFNPPPGWPPPPPGWAPPPGWQPDPSWPPAPAGWSFWLPREV